MIWEHMGEKRGLVWKIEGKRQRGRYRRRRDGTIKRILNK